MYKLGLQRGVVKPKANAFRHFKVEAVYKFDEFHSYIDFRQNLNTSDLFKPKYIESLTCAC